MDGNLQQAEARFVINKFDFKPTLYLDVKRRLNCLPGDLTCKNSLMNHAREYWYIGSILANDDTVKNSIDECFATYSKNFK